MRICVAQCNPTVGAVRENVQMIQTSLEWAKGQGADLVVFPELCVSGAPLHDLLFHKDFVDECERAFEEIASGTKGLWAIIGSPTINEEAVHNGAIVFHDGKVYGRQFQSYLPWEIEGKRVALLVGEEQLHEMNGEVDLVIQLAASPWTVGHSFLRKRVICQRAQALKVPYLFVNMVGANDEWIFDGSSLYVDAKGEIVWQAESFKAENAIVEKSKVVDRSDIEDVHAALLLGIRDYFDKQGVVTAHIALSGGIDSSVTAALLTEALGSDRVQGLFFPSRFTADRSRENVEQLVKNLGISLQTVSIEPLFEGTLSVLESAGKKPEGLAVENIQSRIRTLLLMAFSNMENSMVVGTSNKSEVTVGYGTIYGDISGALLPLGDLFKSEVYEMAHHIRVIPEAILQRAPTAELRENQHDTDDFPEYAKLDSVLRPLVLLGAPSKEIAEKTGFELSQVESLAQKMWDAEYKRRQAPCILRVSPRAFGSEAKYPIVNGLRAKN